MRLGDRDINGLSVLAPMAGVADRALRELCVSFGASYCVSEMVSAKGLVLGDRESARLLEVSQKERPMAVQLFGSEPEIMHSAVKMAVEHNPEAIDINMGCPAPKITSGGAGSALMKTPSLCAELTAAAREAAGHIPVTVKMRTGWDEENKNFLEVASLCEKAGCAAITLHARTKQRMYAPPAEWECITELKKAVSVPVIGNGDVCSGEDA
ncbi:MAG: tRNA-dihydrouridine synthase family protein, partial [Clostridia bacterium]|nr:tRNA-dihydrouridine synthase family protein [Clostridia bacterium]